MACATQSFGKSHRSVDVVRKKEGGASRAYIYVCRASEIEMGWDELG
jgi:hypothetical protein